MINEFNTLIGVDLVGEIARLDTRAERHTVNVIRNGRIVQVQPMAPSVMLFSDNLGNENEHFHNNQDNYRESILRKTILIRTTFCILRTLLLFMFYYMDDFQCNSFISPLISILIIHESILMINFLTFTLSTYIKRAQMNNLIDNESFIGNTDTSAIRKGVEIVDLSANVLFFIWFLWGNYKFLFLKDEVIQSLDTNRYLTYYLTLMVLFGYFIYSRIIFGLIFLVIFGPCILFIILDDYLTKQRQVNRIEVSKIIS